MAGPGDIDLEFLARPSDMAGTGILPTDGNGIGGASTPTPTGVNFVREEETRSGDRGATQQVRSLGQAN